MGQLRVRMDSVHWYGGDTGAEQLVPPTATRYIYRMVLTSFARCPALAVLGCDE